MKPLNTAFFLTALFFSITAHAADCLNGAGSLPSLKNRAGSKDIANPIQHIVVIMQENHSFDSYFGALSKPQFYGNAIDGLQSGFYNTNSSGTPSYVFHEQTLCATDPKHAWDDEHYSWNEGANNGFVAVNGSGIMGYFDETDIPFYYALANTFAVADRYFCSSLTQTFPNRYFLLAATAFGHIKNDMPSNASQWSTPTIFDLLDEYGISWKYYTDDQGYLSLFGPLHARDLSKMQHVSDYQADLAMDSLPSVAFIDASFDGEDEHPDANIQKGQAWVAAQVQSLMDSDSWASSVLFLTYDENGGFYDHVPPPEACEPDNILPQLSQSNYPGKYDRYGFRVPFVAISPYAKHHYVSHVTYDHTSILKYIETKFNLPALTRRDANADGMDDLFDYAHPDFTVPYIPQPTVSAECTGE